MKKWLVSSKLFITCKRMINFSSLRLDNSIQFLDTSPIRIGLKFVFLNLGSEISEKLLFLSFKENPDGFVLHFATWFFLYELSSAFPMVSSSSSLRILVAGKIRLQLLEYGPWLLFQPPSGALLASSSSLQALASCSSPAQTILSNSGFSSPAHGCQFRSCFPSQCQQGPSFLSKFFGSRRFVLLASIAKRTAERGNAFLILKIRSPV